jgi:2-octaprenyl-6-methoxyphenol hydroxylase
MKQYDIIIIGAGYVGLTAALMLKNLGLNVIVLEKKQLNIIKKAGEPSRLLAIAHASCNIFNKHNAIKDFSKLGQEIKQIKVMDATSDDFLEFTPSDIDLDHFGYMVEEHILHKELLQNSKDIETLDNVIIEEIKQDQHFGYVTINSSSSRAQRGDPVLEKKELDCFTKFAMTLKAKMIIVADGKNSEIRNNLGIETHRHDYKQYALVCDIKHELNHQGCAIERFLPTGPFGILPKQDGFTSSIVWSIEKEIWQSIKQLDKPSILHLIQERFGEDLGKIEFASEIATFPLELVHAKNYYNGRFVLLGDAAHAIHPLAGQGLNLSIRDADQLTNLIKNQHDLGLDICSSLMLEEYAKARAFDNNLMIESTHGLNYLFSNNFLPVKFLRRKGLSIVNKLKPLKKIFMKHASGI